MTKNIFTEQPEFIDLDPRKNRPKENGWYSVTPEFMLTKHQTLLPAKLIEGKRVLDLGSCLGATGAWCLSNGASFYKGIEIDEKFIKNSKFCLGKYYPKNSWDITKSSIEDYFSKVQERYDILVAFGVIYGTSDPMSLLKNFANTSDTIVIESMQSNTILHQNILSEDTKKVIIKDPNIVKLLDSSSYIAVGPRTMLTSDSKSLKFPGLNPSMGAIVYLMTQLGFICDNRPNYELRKSIPELFSPTRRFALNFKKESSQVVREFGLRNSFENPSNLLGVRDWHA